MDPFTITMVTAMAYTVTLSDDRKLVLMNAPNGVVTLAAPASYSDKFCTTISNAGFIQMIKLRSAAPIGAVGKIHETMIWPQEKLSLELTDGIWSLKDRCEPKDEGR